MARTPSPTRERHDLMTWVTVQSNDIGDTFPGIYALERSFGAGGADAIGPRLQGKKGIVQLVVWPFWDQSQERLQVAQAVSWWGSTGAGGPAASAWLLPKSVSLFLARTVGKSARSASAMGSEKAAECPAKDFSRGKTCSGGKHFGALAEAKRFGAQTQEARSARSFACMQTIARGATVQ
jgi:hypothetical protein